MEVPSPNQLKLVTPAVPLLDVEVRKMGKVPRTQGSNTNLLMKLPDVIFRCSVSDIWKPKKNVRIYLKARINSTKAIIQVFFCYKTALQISTAVWEHCQSYKPNKPQKYLSLVRCRPESLFCPSELQVSHLQLKKAPACSFGVYLKLGSPTKAVLVFKTRRVI